MVEEVGHSDLAKLTASSQDTITISNVKQLSLHNWIDHETPAIAVPGSPNRWSPSYTEVAVPQDEGEHYMPQHTARYPDSPPEPIFRAFNRTAPNFDRGAIDVVTDRSNNPELLVFISPQMSKKETQRWTMCVEMVNNTALFCPQKTQLKRFVDPSREVNYGHGFENKSYVTKRTASSGSMTLSNVDTGLTQRVRTECLLQRSLSTMQKPRLRLGKWTGPSCKSSTKARRSTSVRR